ncbi:acyltransferase family protein [Beduini massiliensis]|uniref:acyltransferase family protein n=1 Tax=Beduini massiliensis TaxID=1585974 RepID=UPI00059AA4E0|nr:acyltransferase family protein [Beduini massiliensis]
MISKKLSKTLLSINIIFALMIVYMHATNIKIYDYNTSRFGSLFNTFQIIMSKDILAVCVPGFFIISAYLFYINLEFNTIKTKIFKRIKTIFVPYLIWNTIALLYFFIISNLFSNLMNMNKIELTFQTLFSGIFLFQYSPVNWFIYQLIIFILLSPILYVVCSNKKSCIISMIIISILVLFNYNNSFISTSSFMPCLRIDSLLYYVFGIYMAKHNNILENIEQNFSMYKACAIFLISQIIIYVDYLSQYNLFFIGVILYFIALIRFFYGKYWKFLDKSFTSFFVFQIHGFILEPIEKIIFLVFGNRIVFGVLDYFIAPIICLIFIYIITIIMKKYTPGFYKLLVGGR